MKVTVTMYYSQKIQEVQKELDSLLKKLKQKKQMTRKDKRMLHKKISQLYEDLRDLKYRAAY